MDYRKLGNSGLSISEVGVGCNNFGRRADQSAANAVVNSALECGINFFDTADVYGPRGLSEEILGKALGSRRADVVIATKFGSPMADDPFTRGASRGYILRAVVASLKRLGTDYIDLYQIHTPDPDTPIEETMAALDDLVHRGVVRYIGHSNFAAWQAAQCHYVAAARNVTPFISAQNEYNLLERGIEKELIPACEAFGVGILPYFPLASGFLSGKYERGKPLPQGTRISNSPAMQQQYLSERTFSLIEQLVSFAKDRGHTLLELSFAWLLAHRVIGSVIAGAMTADQVRANANAAAWRLSAEDFAAVEDLLKRSD